METTEIEDTTGIIEEPNIETPPVMKPDDIELQELVTQFVAEIPEAFRDLLPASLTPVQTISWIRKARSKGLFQTPSTNIEPIGNIAPIRKQAPDYNNMSSKELLQTALK